MRRTVIILSLVFLAGLALLARSAGRTAAPAAGSTLRVLFTGETLGRQEACVCDDEFAGGLEFRRAYLAGQSPPFLLVDTGNVSSGTTETNLRRGAAILRAMAEQGYQAVNLGETELAAGCAGLRDFAQAGVPLVSLNLRPTAGAASWQESLALKVGGVGVRLTGLADDAYAVGEGLRLEPPREALARWLQTAPHLSAAVVVLADLGLDQARTLALDFPEITLILFRGRNQSHLPERVNRTIIASIYGGRYVGDLSLAWQGRRTVNAKGKTELLDRRWAKTAPPRPVPMDVEVRPAQLKFGSFRRGQTQTAILTLINHQTATVTLGRIFCPCTCFAANCPATAIAPNSEARLEVSLHSLELTGNVSFNLFVEIKGASSGFLMIPASAHVAEASSAESRP